MNLFGKDTYNYINNEIDYKKITDAIVEAKAVEENIIKEQIEKDKQALIEKRLKDLNVENCFDENGNLKNIRAFLKFCWNFMRAKEESLKDISLLSEIINGLVATFFAIIEWVLYGISLAIVCVGAFNYLYKTILKDVCFSPFNFYMFFGNIVVGIGLFVLSRMIIRLLKIECLNNKDFNYMLNFFAVIIAVIAIIVSIVVR